MQQSKEQWGKAICMAVCEIGKEGYPQVKLPVRWNTIEPIVCKTHEATKKITKKGG